MSDVRSTMTVAEGVGGWRVIAHRPGYEAVDVTQVRGATTVLGEFRTGDPFGPSTASLTFPAVTMYDDVGDGELFWLAPEVNFDIEWVGELPPGYPGERWVWEGYAMPFDYTETGVTVTLVGALFQLDNYLAKPEYPLQPIAYEAAIRRLWHGKVDLRVRPVEVDWPTWWDQLYVPVAGQQPQFIPTGVSPGYPWTGMVTRETGSFEPALTGYIQTLLASMYTGRGRWTLSLQAGRRALLHHRDTVTEVGPGVLVVHPLHPGVKVALTEDWTQSANVFYGQVKSLSGEGYSGQQVVGDGAATVYKPLAALRQVEPTTDRNTWLQQHRMRKESMLQLQAGLTASDAAKVGSAHLQAFAEPGLTGTITLESDLFMLDPDGAPQPLHRALIVAGMTVWVPGFKGHDEGVLLHIVDTAYDPESHTMSLTVDSKYRDKLSVDEVRMRGRDALSVPRMLIGGKYEPTLPDQLFPWNYAEGSGYIPSSPTLSARRLFEDMPPDIGYPWSEWTQARPPRHPSWKDCYIRIGPASANADENWAVAPKRDGDAAAAGLAGMFGIPVKMSQAGTIRLLQIAAYNADGEVLAVPFHFSLYYQQGVNVMSMPKIPAAHDGLNGYAAGQHYPFFPQAWETYNIDGTQVGTEVPVAVGTAGLVQGWGNDVVPAGYWPGTKLEGDVTTGLLVDEEPWQFNLVGPTPHINQYSVNDLSPYAGYLYCMIYCDAQGVDEVFFMGRMYRQEPGASA